ncbi:MAG: hypothetical protein CVV34_03560 [Methanomicrobiales archaeon HGW-Methanomicrobiales-5]|nr:MAG: hypothetical protein CVV34_03560 [Methanomicrobiales archaeon HGW-Methanomicrobiales-5]
MIRIRFSITILIAMNNFQSGFVVKNKIKVCRETCNRDPVEGFQSGFDLFSRLIHAGSIFSGPVFSSGSGFKFLIKVRCEIQNHDPVANLKSRID